jgi:phage terminase large subunit GpA-like protein
MQSEALSRIRAEFLAALAPPPRLDFADWIEATIRLPGDVSAQTGPMQLTPVQRGIADAIGDPEVERVTVVKPVRLGYSTLLAAFIAYHVENDPAPILAVQPTESDCRGWMVDDLEPIFGASPRLRNLLGVEHDPTGRSTILSRRFPGGSLKLIAAKAPRNLRRHNARILVLDEIDGMESGAEGSPITLAERRTLSFPDRKILAGSTPTLEDTSHVLRLYRESDQRVFEIRCPDCGGFHAPTWKDIVWPEGKPQEAAYVCPDCGTVQPETRKAAMVEAGRWRITRPEVKGHAGFRTNVLVSTLPAASWGNIAREFLAAKAHPDLLQSWTNTLMAEGWRQAGEELNEAELQGRAEPFGLDRLPPEVLVLTAGVDVQHDRLECVTLGHSATETFVLDYRAFWGPVNTAEAPWADLDAFLATRFAHPLGGALGFDAIAVDSSDGHTMDRVLGFTAPRLHRRIVAIKGADGQRPAIRMSATKGHKLFIVGVDGEKARLAERLKRGRSIRFSDGLDRRFYEELASERRIVRYTRGVPSATWERIPGRRAEALDCFVYASAVRGLVGVDLTARADELATLAAPAARTVVARSKWLDS